MTYKLIKDQSPHERVLVEMGADSSVSDLVEVFEAFLYACGFSPNLRIDYYYEDEKEETTTEIEVKPSLELQQD